MTSLIIFFLGTFWEASMDIILAPRNYERSLWKKVAEYFTAKGYPQLGERFWNNDLYWLNKWKNRDPKQGEAFWGSSRWFVMLTDGGHIVKFFWLMHIFAAIVFYTPITNNALLDMLIFYTVFGIGHDFFFALLHKKWTS